MGELRHREKDQGCVVMLGGMTLGAFMIAALVWEVVPWLV